MEKQKLFGAAIIGLFACISFGQDYKVNVVFDNEQVLNEDKLIEVSATVKSDFDLNLLNQEDEYREFNSTIEEQVLNKICNENRYQQLITKDKYFAEIEITLDTGEEYMVVSLDSCS